LIRSNMFHIYAPIELLLIGQKLQSISRLFRSVLLSKPYSVTFGTVRPRRSFEGIFG
jgi:hypothetical protein